MSDAMTDAYAEQDLDEFYHVIKWLVGMGKNRIALEVAKGAEEHTIAKYKGRARGWQTEIRTIIEAKKTGPCGRNSLDQ